MPERKLLLSCYVSKLYGKMLLYRKIRHLHKSISHEDEKLLNYSKEIISIFDLILNPKNS